MRALHPALVGIAKSNKRIVARYKAGEISAEEARAQLSELVVGDDGGVLWTMDAAGSWLMRNKSGEWVPGTPPKHGLLPPTPEQLGGVMMPGSEMYLAPLELIADGPLGALARAGSEEGSGRRGIKALLLAVRVVMMSDIVMSARVAHAKSKIADTVRAIFNR